VGGADTGQKGGHGGGGVVTRDWDGGVGLAGGGRSRSGHMGQTGQQAGWLAGPKGWVGPAERLRPNGEGEASGFAGPKAEWAGKGS
jgi:hypothetical protein